jgi:hypothetical protein
MKVALIRLATASGKTELHTDNDSGNAPMLAINQQLGFVRRTATISMVKKNTS